MMNINNEHVEKEESMSKKDKPFKPPPIFEYRGNLYVWGRDCGIALEQNRPFCIVKKVREYDVNKITFIDINKREITKIKPSCDPGGAHSDSYTAIRLEHVSIVLVVTKSINWELRLRFHQWASELSCINPEVREKLLGIPVPPAPPPPALSSPPVPVLPPPPSVPPSKEGEAKAQSKSDVNDSGISNIDIERAKNDMKILELELSNIQLNMRLAEGRLKEIQRIAQKTSADIENIPSSNGDK